ncbi:MAG TPA: DedA family protein [Roseiflexaceae bacterium]|jgi:membrane protein DedA with SNARE-associated domain|nr:DedA family protein [Roseiflexaceae bacterium]
MLNLLARHGFIAILVAVLIEEVGIPMPLPTDILIVLAGVESAGHFPRLVFWFCTLSCASATGATGLYFITRWGGRPLVERFGRYVHLGPEQLARGERLLQRRGWFGIAVGRAIPGLRYATVIVCGLLRVPYFRFLTAHVVGSSLYIATFLALGATFGPAIISNIHVPSRTINLLWLLMLAIGLPLLIMWLSWRAHPQVPAHPSTQRLFWSNFVASFLGATVLAASWSAAATYADLVGTPRPVNAIATLVRWLLGRGLGEAPAYILIYAGLLLLCFAVSAAYYQFLVPHLSPRIGSLPMQVAELGLMTSCLVSIFFILTLSVVRYGPLLRWWNTGGPWLFGAIILGILGYAFTTAYGRTLGLAVLPSFYRVQMGQTTRRALQAEIAHHRYERNHTAAAEPNHSQPASLVAHVEQPTITGQINDANKNGSATSTPDSSATQSNNPVTKQMP